MLPDSGRKVKQYFNYHITPEEFKILLSHARKHCDTKIEIALLLMAFRGMRPSECLAANILDFKNEYTRLSYREAKTNKIRSDEVIVKPLAVRIKTYVAMNAHRLADGYLFPFYTKKTSFRKGKEVYCPYMDSMTFCNIFNEMRKKIGKTYPSFNEKYEHKYTNGKSKWVYRIHPYSLRRFFETYFYIANSYNLALLKEIMEYSSSFDPMKHYIRIVHREEQKEDIMEKTFSSLARELIDGQTHLQAFT